MSYEKAKEKFEAIVARMQLDLKDYANKPGASQRAIDAKLDDVNALVEFYTLANELISEEEMKNMELQLAYTRLHTDTSKLVVFCELHRVNPNLVFHYTLAELEQMHDNGVRIIPPKIDPDQIKWVHKNGGIELELQTESMEKDEKAAVYDRKYQMLNLLTQSRC